MKNHYKAGVLKKITAIGITFLFAYVVMGIDSLAIANSNSVFIASDGVSEDTLSGVDIKNIFLGKKTTWSSGSKITFVTLKSGNTHKDVLRTYLKRNPGQFKNHWKQMLFTGKGVIPKSFTTDEEVVSYISQNENAIGYVSKTVTADGIKIISISK